MKISKDTLQILKSFASINPCIFLGDPKSIRVITPDKSAVIGVYKTSEVLDKDCVFWDWPQLLATIENMGGENAELDFQEKFVKITSEDKSSLKYFYTSEIAVSTQQKPKAYEAYCKAIDEDFSFEITSEMLTKLLKIAKTLNLDLMKITMKDGTGTIELCAADNKINHTHNMDIEGKGTGEINIWINLLQIVNGSYEVVGKNNLFTKWTNKNIPLFYIVASGKKAN